MTFHSLATEIEAEAVRSRDWQPCRDLARKFPANQRVAYDIVFQWIETREIPSAHSGPPVDPAQRLAACRLVLLLLFADTDTPRWSSGLLSEAVRATLAIPGAEPSDLLRVMWELTVERRPLLTRTWAEFIRWLSLTFLVEHRDRRVELHWLVESAPVMTAAEAFFKFQVLVLRPEFYTDEVEAEVLTQLRNDPIAQHYV